MCGIVGCVWKNGSPENALELLKKATDSLSKRGPDAEGFYQAANLDLGHRRLSIIDTSSAANQPFHSADNRYALVFNGEIFNYKELRKELEERAYQFRTSSDTEVLLNCLIEYGQAGLNKLNGFFAFAFYDKQKHALLLARDRFGIKPLVFSNENNQFCFASEIKALMPYGISKEINFSALFTYLQLSYIPQPVSMLKSVQKLPSGHFISLTNLNEIPQKIESQAYYKLERNEKAPTASAKNYIDNRRQLKSLLEASVEKRLMSDVPIGTFLSGGIDSSVISTIASQKVKSLKTFSIGFKDEPYFDETHYANKVAEKIGSDHHVFHVSNADLYDSLLNTLDYLDEPFADSSALAVNLLCEKTAAHVKVALSGDGADELFSGYNKHAAEFRIRNPQLGDKLLPLAGAVLPFIPQSRNSRMGNFGRKLDKFIKGNKLGKQERYWLWASLQSEEEANYFIKEAPHIRQQRLSDDAFAYKKLKEHWLKYVRKDGDLNDVLLADQQLVLTNDMLKKVDSMSMANSMEVRTPFLDHTVVEFVNRLPVEYKINQGIRKRILQDAYRKELPEELYNRPKKGFEVPLLNWFRHELKPMIEHDLLNKDYIIAQGIFNPEAIRELKLKLYSKQPGDAAAVMWMIIVFQYWWKNLIEP